MTTHTDPRDAKIAALLADNYDLIGHLGKGGFATVYSVRNRRLNRVEALKVLSADLEEPDFADRFRQEARLAASLDHPHIVKIFDFGQAGDLCWFTMQLIEGPTLIRELKQKGPWSETDSARLGADVLDALDYSHRRGIIHRDIKPENILIDEERRPYLMDFGIAKSEQSVVHTRTGTILGSPAYIAPEQLTAGAVDGRADIYSLGATLYRMVSNSFPFQDSDPVRMAMKRFTMPPEPLEPKRPGIDPGFVAIVMRALEREPANRFATAGEMAAYLRTFLAGRPVSLPPPVEKTVLLPEPVGTPRAFSAPFPSMAGTGGSAAAAAGAADSSAIPTVRTPRATAPAPVAAPPERRSRAALFAGIASVVLAAAVVAYVLRTGGEKASERSPSRPAQPSPAARHESSAAPVQTAPPVSEPVAASIAPTSPPAAATPAPAAPRFERPAVHTARREESRPRAESAPEPPRRRPVVPAQTESEAAIEISPDVAREFGNRSVGLSVIVAEDGHAREARVISPLCPECDRAARAAVMRYRFKPARDAEGKPIESRVAVPVIIPAPENP